MRADPSVRILLSAARVGLEFVGLERVGLEFAGLPYLQLVLCFFFALTHPNALWNVIRSRAALAIWTSVWEGGLGARGPALYVQSTDCRLGVTGTRPSTLHFVKTVRPNGGTERSYSLLVGATQYDLPSGSTSQF